MDFKDKKVLLIGLGILGGGVSIANWLMRNGARLAIFDAKKKEDLAKSIKQIKGEAQFFFETCPHEVIEDADSIVVNQAVPMTNPEVLFAEKLGKPIFNESNIFYEMCEKPVIAVTGTRGKTTTTNWIAHLLGPQALVAGNSEQEPLLKVLPKVKSKACSLVVNEIPSFQLERFQHAPEIALITNIFNDHLNRHGTMENYARTKAAIFKNQDEHEKLILNADNAWTEFFLNLEPRSELWFFSVQKLPEDMMGVYYSDGGLFLRTDKDDTKIFNAKQFIETWGMHNLENLSAAILAAYLSGEEMSAILKRIPTLPQIKFREESIYRSKHLEIINDTAATSPEGGIAALERFAGPETILIAGGTDAGLDYKLWAKKVLETIQPSHAILLSGSATEKMRAKLQSSAISVFDTLEGCVDEALEKIQAMKKGKKAVLLFSPAAKSFEKFKNEFDRGEQFNAIISKLTRRLP